MAIFLYTDFGSADVYVGQMKAALHARAPGVVVIDLLHDAPPFNVEASAHLLAALVPRLPEDAVVVAVVDPGVGGARRPIALRADGRWFVGPDNGLVSVVAARATTAECRTIRWRPEALSASFHGRDLFAPFAAMLAAGSPGPDAMAPQPRLDVAFGAADLAQVIYIDHFGNAMTGLRAQGVARERCLAIGSRELEYARVYSEVGPGELFWYENSIGLIEVAAHAASAAAALGLRVGDPVVLR